MQIRLTEAEYEAIERKFRNSGLRSRSEFVRAMIFEGYIVHFDEEKFDKIDPATFKRLQVSEQELAEAKELVPEELKQAIRQAKNNIEIFLILILAYLIIY